MPRFTRRITTIAMFAAAGLLLMAVPKLDAQTIDQSRGVDARVDYSSLVGIGPWDDRNYELTLEDIEYLAPNERELGEGIPAFYRVHLRKTMMGTEKMGVQYPRSGLPRFFLEHGGFLIDGKIYTGSGGQHNDWKIDTSQGGTPAEEFFAKRAEVVAEIDRAEVRSLEGEVRVTNPIGAAESAISINPTNPDQVIAGTNGPGGGQRMHFSTDGGETWVQAAALPLGGTCCDPTIEWSVDGTKAYTATLGSAVFFYRSADAGQTWTDLDTEPGNDPRRELGSGVDKEYIHVDRSPTSPHSDNIYVTWHEQTNGVFNTMQFARSTDLGNTFTIQSFTSDPRGIGSDITTDKAGTVYYFWPDFTGQRIVLKRSTDGGVTFENGVVTVANTEGSFIFPIPSTDARQVFIYNSVAVDYSDGPFGDSIYAAWTDSTGPTGGNPDNNHARIQVAYSRDGGDTWTVTTPHETADELTVDRWHQWLAVGPDGKVYVMFYDTRVTGRSGVDVFYSMSDDGAQTWSAPARLTTVTSPDSNTGSPNDFEFGDYNGMDVAMNRLIAIFTDNRDETGGTARSIDVYAAGITLTGGGDEIFADGFESGDTSVWSVTIP